MSIFLVLLLLCVALVLFITEAVRIDLVGLGIIIAVVALGFCSPEEAFAGFSNSALLTVAAMYVLSAGLDRTGALAFLANRIIHFSRGGPRRLLLLLMLSAVVMSAFITNTTVVIIFIPVVIAISQEFGSSPSRLLMPLSFASIFGGTCTLVGTSTNLLVSSLAVSHGYPAIGMFELAPMGLIVVAIGIPYLMTIGRRLLPERRPVSHQANEAQREYLTEMVVREGSVLVNKRLGETVLARLPDLTVLQVVRGEQIIWPPLDGVIIQAEDVLMLRGGVETLATIHGEHLLEILPELASGQIYFDPKQATLAEAVILPHSPLVGMRVGDARFRRLHGVTVMALQRRGTHFRDKVTEMDLRPGDILLLYGDTDAVRRLRKSDEFIVLGQQRTFQPQKARAAWALSILGLVVGLATLGISSILLASMAGALAMVATGCIRPKEAYDALDLKILVFIAGALALGKAIESTGTADLMTHHLLSMAGPHGPLVTLAAVYLLTMLATEMLSNSAAAVLLFPIAASAAEMLGVSIRPFMIAVTFAASASFSTPIGYQTNTLIYGAGGYRFSDFLRVGPPLNLLLWAASVIFIPVFWPF
ncbi:MAG: SLC13 family permease [Acidobacteriota bacterium]